MDFVVPSKLQISAVNVNVAFGFAYGAMRIIPFLI
jgi:hypothetical protein